MQRPLGAAGLHFALETKRCDKRMRPKLPLELNALTLSNNDFIPGTQPEGAEGRMYEGALGHYRLDGANHIVLCPTNLRKSRKLQFLPAR